MHAVFKESQINMKDENYIYHIVPQQYAVHCPQRFVLFRHLEKKQNKLAYNHSNVTKL